MYLTCLAVLPVMAPAQRPSCSQPRLVEFDVPGPVPANSQTSPYANNDLGEVVGNYVGASGHPVAFLRAPDGKITSFLAPGAFASTAFAINDLGVIAGRSHTSDGVFHAFVRYIDGSFTTFEAPGAGTASGTGTGAWAINLEGATAGAYWDTSGAQHGFAPWYNGQIEDFDPEGSTYAFVCQSCLNLEGVTTGYYADVNGTYHGFVRKPDGKITVIDAPGADLTPGDGNGTFPGGINVLGAITGSYLDAKDIYHGFVRTPGGHITQFDVPGAGAVLGSYEGTLPASINALGVIAGYFYDASYVAHGFSRSPDGHITPINAPDAGSVLGTGQGTYPATINLEGAVTGPYYDTNGNSHGFVWTPPSCADGHDQ